ncbi:hypothetical protein PTKU46_94160 [Paraburkholderia terrae]
MRYSQMVWKVADTASLRGYGAMARMAEPTVLNPTMAEILWAMLYGTIKSTRRASVMAHTLAAQ